MKLHYGRGAAFIKTGVLAARVTSFARLLRLCKWGSFFLCLLPRTKIFTTFDESSYLSACLDLTIVERVSTAAHHPPAVSRQV